MGNVSVSYKKGQVISQVPELYISLKHGGKMG